jgi:hypothetical protein
MITGGTSGRLCWGKQIITGGTSGRLCWVKQMITCQPNTVKPPHVVTSIKQSPVLKGYPFLALS